MSAFLVSLLVVLLSFAAGPAGVAAQQEYSSVCFLFYSLPGNIDYPWSVAVYLQFDHDLPQQTNEYGTYQQIYDSRISYTYTNKFGTASTTHIAYPDNIGPVYVGNVAPVDPTGLQFTLYDVDSVQLPGVGPLQTFQDISLSRDSNGNVALGAASLVSGLGQSWTSNNLANFVNHTIGSDWNMNYADYYDCRAPITTHNGRVPPIQPSSSNCAQSFSYSYTITDGSTYTVTTSLTIGANSQFPTGTDQLGNVYQTITSVSGTRTYTYLGEGGGSVTSTVTGLSTALGTPSQFWYPFAYLQSSPGVYTVNTAPFLDGDGLGFSISPAAPVNGNPVGSGTQYSDITVRVAAVPNDWPRLTEANYNTLPNILQQQQTYTLNN